MKPFVDRLQVENFACIKSVDIPLTRLHAFIGPNDSGKSTLLRAISFLTQYYRAADYPGPDQLPVTGKYAVTAHVGDGSAQIHWHYGKRGDAGDAVRGSQLVRLEPDALRKPCSLIPRGAPVAFTSSRGAGLAGVLDAMVSRNPEAYFAVRSRFVELFAGVERVEVQNDDSSHKVIGAVLRDGRQIGPAEMSEGMLYWLAFKALQYATRPSILLVEEPENGLHPARVREVMSLLREISQETQVLIATHSPLVINELKPEEVTIFTRTEEQGTIATPMTATKNFAQRSSIYALGELWLSYADGVLEQGLMPDESKDTKAAG